MVDFYILQERTEKIEAEMASKALFFADPPNDPRKSW